MMQADKLVNLAMGATSGKRKGIIKRLTKRPNHSFQEAGMKLSRQEVESIAHLARLEISADEIPVYVDNLSRIIDFVRQLDRAQTEGVEPMAHPLNMTQPLREDASHRERPARTLPAECAGRGSRALPRAPRHRVGKEQMPMHGLTLAGIARALQAREFSSEELVRHFLGRIERLDGELNAFITLTARVPSRRPVRPTRCWRPARAGR
jgi:aspartyl-tRNA(Asn)/glutamyl-tRNA(Gln) amidotransferase subunit C